MGENSSSMVIRAKVADFGLSRFKQSSMNEKSKTDLLNKRKENEEAKTPDYGSRIMTAGQGTAVYMAPEIVSSAMHTYSSYSMKVDVYVVDQNVFISHENHSKPQTLEMQVRVCADYVEYDGVCSSLEYRFR